METKKYNKLVNITKKKKRIRLIVTENKLVVTIEEKGCEGHYRSRGVRGTKY